MKKNLYTVVYYLHFRNREIVSNWVPFMQRQSLFYALFKTRYEAYFFPGNIFAMKHSTSELNKALYTLPYRKLIL